MRFPLRASDFTYASWQCSWRQNWPHNVFLCDWSPADKVQPPTGVTVMHHCPASFSCLLVSQAAVSADVFSAGVTGPEPSGYGILRGCAPGTGLQISSTYFIVAIKLPDFQHASCPRRMMHLSSWWFGRNWADWSWRLFSDSKEFICLSNWKQLSSSAGRRALLFPALYYTGVVWVLLHLGKLHTVGEVRLN